MSIALVVKKGKSIVIGADSQHNFGSNTTCDKNIKCSKIRKIGPVYFTNTGWGLYDDILNDYLSTKKSVKLSNSVEVFQFFKTFWEALHKNYPYVNDQCDDKESPFADLDANFLIATQKRIFHVSSNMSVSEFLKFHAIGSGCEFALGAMHAAYRMKLSAADIAKKGLEAAIAHDLFCGGEMEIIKV